MNALCLYDYTEQTINLGINFNPHDPGPDLVRYLCP